MHVLKATVISYRKLTYGSKQFSTYAFEVVFSAGLSLQILVSYRFTHSTTVCIILQNQFYYISVVRVTKIKLGLDSVQKQKSQEEQS